MTRVRLAFLGGCGHLYLRQCLREDPQPFELAVSGDGVDDAAAERLATQLDARYEPSAERLLDTFKPEVVNVGGVHGRNGALARLALERGCRVVSDKPVAATREQLAQLRAVLRPESVLLTEFPFRALPEFVAARDAVASGQMGELQLLTGQKSYRFGTRPAWYGTRDTYTTTLLWIASHALDVFRFVTGAEATVTAAQSGGSGLGGHAAVDAYVAVMLRMGAATALAHADYLRPAQAPTHGDDRLRVVGTRGVVEVRDGRCVLLSYDAPPADITPEAGRSVGQTLLACALGEAGNYSTTESLRTAELLLSAQEALDAGR